MSPHKNPNTFAKVNHILNIILVFLLLILFRIWHVSVLQHDEFSEKAQKPQLREVVEAPNRGTIVDRLGKVVAQNKLQYDLAIFYQGIQEIPRLKVVKNAKGEKQRLYPRKAYIEKLSGFLAEELGEDANRIEDLIYSKASILPQVPYVIQENISEALYYRMKYLERRYPGLLAQKKAKRDYPWGEVGSSVIGNIGRLSAQEYHNFYTQVKYLDDLIADQDQDPFLILPKGMKSLSDVQQLYEQLKEKAYRLNDLVGKTGIEASFNHELQGYRGRRVYLSNAQGRYVKELSDVSKPSPGKCVELTLSMELQQFCEELLVKSEGYREGSSRGFVDGVYTRFKQPWIKGGAIVVMDPKNGDVIALASYPKVPSRQNGGATFSHKKKQALQQIENEEYVQGIWEGQWPLEKEVYRVNKRKFETQSLYLSFSEYLKQALGQGSLLIAKLKKMKLAEAVELQRVFYTLFAKSQEKDAANFINNCFPSSRQYLVHERWLSKHTPETLKALFLQDPFFTEKLKYLQAQLEGIADNYEKLLCLDLTRLIVDEKLFSDVQLRRHGFLTLENFKEMQGAFFRLEKKVKGRLVASHYQKCFLPWRQKHQKVFLKEKRQEERRNRRYAKPYLDYLDQECQRQFEVFWAKHRLSFLYAGFQGVEGLEKDFKEEIAKIFQEEHPEIPLMKKFFKVESFVSFIDLCATFRDFSSLNTPLMGRYFGLREVPGKQRLKDLALAFYPKYGYGFSRSYAYQVPATLGSIFKLVPSYTGLKKNYFEGVEKHPQLFKQLNPLEITDQWHWQKNKEKKELIMGYFSNGKPIPRIYKHGRLPKSERRNIGKVDLVKAIETSSNPYFSLLSGDITGGEALYESARSFGFGSKTGIQLPLEHKGYVPEDIKYNHNALYAMSIGQHTLEVTPLQTAVMLSGIVNGGAILEPRIVKRRMGADLNLNFDELFSRKAYPYRGCFENLGLCFPLITLSMDRYESQSLASQPTHVNQWMAMPRAIQSLLAEGMRRVVSGSGGCARREMIREYNEGSGELKDYDKLRPYLMGKTSTSECVERVDTARKCRTYNHIWFAGVSFDKPLPHLADLVKESTPFTFYDQYGTPEICVVVYLKYGSYGREAAPLAAAVMEKWKEINRR